MDQESGEIVASLLTTDDVGDETALLEFIASIKTPVSRVLVGEAYDARNEHLKSIAEVGRMAWQPATGYHDRALVEAQISRWKQVIGETLKSRNIDTQITEIRTGTKALNRMTGLGRASFEHV